MQFVAIFHSKVCLVRPPYSFLAAAAGVAVVGGVAAVGGTGAVVAGCTVLEKNKKAAENAVQLASEKLDDKQKAFKRQGLLNFVNLL